MPGIIDLPKFNYEDLEEIVAGGRMESHNFLMWSFVIT